MIIHKCDQCGEEMPAPARVVVELNPQLVVEPVVLEARSFELCSPECARDLLADWLPVPAAAA